MADELGYVRSYYGVPAELGMRVTVDGKPGVIVSGEIAHYIHVKFDDDPYPRYCHPTWRVDYPAAASRVQPTGEQSE